jgi:hypothetical protein
VLLSLVHSEDTVIILEKVCAGSKEYVALLAVMKDDDDDDDVEENDSREAMIGFRPRKNSSSKKKEATVLYEYCTAQHCCWLVSLFRKSKSNHRSQIGSFIIIIRSCPKDITYYILIRPYQTILENNHG